MHLREIMKSQWWDVVAITRKSHLWEFNLHSVVWNFLGTRKNEIVRSLIMMQLQEIKKSQWWDLVAIVQQIVWHFLRIRNSEIVKYRITKWYNYKK